MEAQRAAVGGAERAGVVKRGAETRNPQSLGAAGAAASGPLQPVASLALTRRPCLPVTADSNTTGDAAASAGCEDAEIMTNSEWTNGEEKQVMASVEIVGVEWGLEGEGLPIAGTTQHSYPSITIQYNCVEQQGADGLCGQSSGGHPQGVLFLVSHDLKALGDVVKATHTEFLRSLNMQSLRKQAKAKLPDNAVLVLRRWWEENQDWPYPSVSTVM